MHGHMIIEDGIEQMILINKSQNEIDSTIEFYNKTNKPHKYIAKLIEFEVIS